MEQAWTVTSGQPSTAWSDDSSGRDMIPQADPVIVADNQLPAEYGRELTEIDFSYENPTVARVAHPGPSQAKTLSKDSEGTCSPAPTPGSTTSEATSTTPASTPNVRSATTSAHSNQPPDPTQRPSAPPSVTLARPRTVIFGSDRCR